MARTRPPKKPITGGKGAKKVATGGMAAKGIATKARRTLAAKSARKTITKPPRKKL